MLFNLLVLSAFAVALLLLRRMVNILPSLLACIIRGKENLNLEASVKLSRDRNLIAMAMAVPFCLIAFRYRLYNPGYLEGMSENAVLGIYFAIFCTYGLLRLIVKSLLRPQKMQRSTYNTAYKASFNFFIIGTILLLAVAAISSVLDLSEIDTRSAMLWISALIYTLFLLRKTQIFSTSCSVFAGFLYLCALEIIPTGILVVSAIIF
ncbi:MAG: DUF4271 domain-containing protein [Bacteroidales bacterium]|nr:DUF4271 domain-containing protein [Bacteroidales bacterium]